MKALLIVRIALEQVLIWSGVVMALLGTFTGDDRLWVHGSLWFLIGAVGTIVRRANL